MHNEAGSFYMLNREPRKDIEKYYILSSAANIATLHPNRASNYMNVSYNNLNSANSSGHQNSRPVVYAGDMNRAFVPQIGGAYTDANLVNNNVNSFTALFHQLSSTASYNMNVNNMNNVNNVNGGNFGGAYNRVYDENPQYNRVERTDVLNYLMGRSYVVDNVMTQPNFNVNNGVPYETNTFNNMNQVSNVSHDQGSNLQTYYNILKYSMNSKNVPCGGTYNTTTTNNNCNVQSTNFDRENALNSSINTGNSSNIMNKYVNEPRMILKNRYVCANMMGKGAFGRVFKAYDLMTDREVAVKIIDIANVTLDQTTTELAILDDLNRNDPLNFHVVRKLDHFQHLDDQVVVFEMMQCTLYDKLRQRLHVGFNLSEVKEIAVKLLLCLCYIWKRRIIHCDLKPENIMYYADNANTQQQGMRLNNGLVQLQLPGVAPIKVVDFGSSTYFGQQKYSYIQSRFYRAPEVIMQIPYDEKIDVWSMGCVLGELVHGEAMFTGRDEYDQMKRFVRVLGWPPDEMLAKAKNSQMVANIFQDCQTSSIGQFLASTKNQANLCDASLLEDPNGVQVYPTLERFITDILVYDPRKRPDPCTLFLHPFITNLVTVNPSLMGFLALRSNASGEYCQCEACIHRVRY